MYLEQCPWNQFISSWVLQGRWLCLISLLPTIQSFLWGHSHHSCVLRCWSMNTFCHRVHLVNAFFLAGAISVLLLQHLFLLPISRLLLSLFCCGAVVLVLTALLAVGGTFSQTGTRGLPAVSPYAAAAGFGDAPIKVDHDGYWQVKSCYGCPKCHSWVWEELYVALIWWHGSPSHDELPEQNGWSPQDEGQDPGGCNHQTRHLGASVCWVTQRFGDTEVTVKTDDEQVHDWGVANYIINSQPQVTHHCSQGPVANHNVDSVEVHGADTNNEVCTSQAEQEVVVDSLQVPVYL